MFRKGEIETVKMIFLLFLLVEAKCIDHEGSIKSSNGSTILANINDPCNDVLDCPEFAICNTRCQCNDGYIQSSDLAACLPIVTSIERAECKERQQCQKGSPGPYSDCDFQPGSAFKTCQCTMEGVPVNEICYKKAIFVGDACDKPDQCLAMLGNSYCKHPEDICACETGYFESSDRRQCLPRANLGETCLDDTQCADIGFAVCLPDDPPSGVVRKTCQCSPGYISDPAAGNICFKMAEKVGDSCSAHRIQCDNLDGAKCIPGTDITKAYCLCDASTEVTSLDGRRCLTARDRLNETCDETAQCRPLNSVCARSTGDAQLRCICASDFVEFDQPSRCLKVAMELGQPCQENIQCSKYLGELTECRLGRCDCSHRALPYNGRCFVKASLGAYCQAYEECHLGASNYSYCDVRDSRCKCLTDAIEWNQLCWGDKQIGDVCSRNEECDVSIDGPTLCQGMRCACSPGYEADDVTNKVCVSEGSFMRISIGLLMVTTLLSYFK